MVRSIQSTNFSSTKKVSVGVVATEYAARVGASMVFLPQRVKHFQALSIDLLMISTMEIGP